MKKLLSIGIMMCFIFVTISSAKVDAKVHNLQTKQASSIKNMFLCHITANGTGSSLWLAGANFNGTALVFYGTTYLAIDGYTKMTSLINPHNDITVSGKQIIIFNGYFGSFTCEGKKLFVNISMDGVAFLTTIISLSKPSQFPVKNPCFLQNE